MATTIIFYFYSFSDIIKLRKLVIIVTEKTKTIKSSKVLPKQRVDTTKIKSVQSRNAKDFEDILSGKAKNK